VSSEVNLRSAVAKLKDKTSKK